MGMADGFQVRIGRREILLGAAATTLAVVAYPSLRQVGSYPPVDRPFTSLSPKEVAVYRAVGDFLLPPGGPLPGHGGDDVTLAGIDGFFAALPPHQARVVGALPHLIEHGSALDRYGARCMTALSPERQVEYLTAWATAELVLEAQLWSAVKVVFTFGYFDRADVLEAMGVGSMCRGQP